MGAWETGVHCVIVATNGREALELLLAGRTFDVILCDLMMPVVTGIDVSEAVDATRPDLVARMVFMTGGACSEAGTRFLASAARRVLYKPFTVQSLRAVVADYVKGDP